MNRFESPHDVEIDLRGARIAGPARRCELSAPSPLSVNTVAAPDVVAPEWSDVELDWTPVISVPPCSYTIHRVPLA
ncbi:hypothetical protein [Streptomyces sp. B6B3]|uniref:hypothetical protein n=1 Tax=Streptomyces sp. B6B3 TaxID=3153570 RepID=UPI00325DF15D